MAGIASRQATFAVISLACSLAALSTAAQAQSELSDAAALVADQIRQQGYACEEPASATQDPSVEDDSIWTLTCADATYRVRLVPDQAAQVEKLK
ncbi:hypothetical protein ABMA32_08140 [Mesorhizobium sp. VNQ89]|uniref:hypothetical protein n=1 Tax=Mesorhizobium quangtriensis TaxID=3157709 RepID=UPI0032B71AD7